MVTVLEKATSTALVGSAQILAEFPTADPALVDIMIEDATSAIECFTGRTFARQKYRETTGGYSRQQLMLCRRPVVALDATPTFDGIDVEDVVVECPDAGILRREAGFCWTVQWNQYLTRNPIPGSEEKTYSVDYTAGYLLVGDLMDDVTTVSVDDADQSFNDSASSFPILVAGDTFTTTGFGTGANNGTFTVVSRTPSKIVTSATTLVTEAAGATIDLTPASTLPSVLRRAAADLVKTWIYRSSGSMDIKRKKVGPLEIEFNVGGSGASAMPQSVADLLGPWVDISVGCC